MNLIRRNWRNHWRSFHCWLGRIRGIWTDQNSERLFENLQQWNGWMDTARKRIRQLEPSSVALKFLSFFHSSMILPYSFIRQNMKVRFVLPRPILGPWNILRKVPVWVFPLHTSRENILKGRWNDQFILQWFVKFSETISGNLWIIWNWVPVKNYNELYRLWSIRITGNLFQ